MGLVKTSPPADNGIPRSVKACRALSLVCLPLATLALGLAIVGVRGVRPQADGKAYEQLALNLIEHKKYTWGDGETGHKKTHLPKERRPLEPCADYAPLHPAVLAAAISIGRGGYALVGAANALWLAGAVLFTVLLAAEVSGDARVPVIAGLLTAATVPLYSGLTNFYREPLYLFLLTGTAYFLVRALSARSRTVWTLAAALFWGLSILCKPVLLIFVPFYVAFRILCRPAGEPVRSAAFQAAAAVALCALVVAPWVARNVAQGVGPLIASQGGMNFMATAGDTGNSSHRLYPDAEGTRWLLTDGERATLSEAQINRLIYARKLQRLKADPALAARILARNALMLAYFVDGTTGRVHLTWVIAAPFFVAGLWHTFVRRDERRRTRALPAVMVAAFCTGLLIHIAAPGYRLPVEPLVFAASACGIVQFDTGPLLRGGKVGRRLFWAGYLACCLAFYLAYTPAVRSAAARIANEWLW